VGSARTAWHVLLDRLLCQRRPRSFEVRSEVPLSAEPLRPDYLLLRRRPAVRASDSGKTLRKLWHLLPKDAVTEFKSIGRPYRARNLNRLWSYLHIHYADQPDRLLGRSELCGVLLVPARSSSLDMDSAEQGLSWRDLSDGYWQLEGGAFALYVAEIDAVAEAENDDLLRLFGHGKERTVPAEQWLAEQLGGKELAMALYNTEGFSEVMLKVLKNVPPKAVLSAYKPEELLAALKEEDGLAELSPEKVLPALPVEVLKGLSKAYVDALPEPTRAAIRARIAADRAKPRTGKAKKESRARRQPGPKSRA
jgi:hypothetical protein